MNAEYEAKIAGWVLYKMKFTIFTIYTIIATAIGVSCRTASSVE
jgi:hypothetical protein